MELIGVQTISAILSISLLAIVPLLYVLKTWRTTRRLPPGPRGLPIIGNVLSIDKRSYLTFGRWAKIFGDIMTVNIFGTRMIIISEASLGREAYSMPGLSGRAVMQPFEVYFRGEKEYPKEVARGVLGSERAVWAEQRRFTVRHLRDFGFAKTNFTDVYVNEEASFLLKHLRAQEGKSVDLWRVFAHASANVVWRIIAGERIAQDEERGHIIEAASEQFFSMIDSPVAVFLPRIAKLVGKLSGWKKLVQTSSAMHEIFDEDFIAHQKNFSPEKPPRDFLDCYLLKVSETKDTSSSFYGENGVQSLKLAASDFFIGGSETTSATMNWAVLYLTTYPEIQERFSAEILDIVGKSRLPILEDRSKMPFTEATINETLRKSTFTTFGVMHRALEDTELKSYIIPKGTWVCVNQHYVHHDPKVWGDPETFRPERFLKYNSDGTIELIKYPELIPFSFGNRQCIGQQLARDAMFIFLCNIYQNYSTTFDPAFPKPGLEPRTAMFKEAPQFKVLLNSRV